MPEDTPKPKKRTFPGRSCGACKWSKHVDELTGKCRRYPPRLISDPADTTSGYPTVELQDRGCGEFKPPR